LQKPEFQEEEQTKHQTCHLASNHWRKQFPHANILILQHSSPIVLDTRTRIRGRSDIEGDEEDEQIPKGVLHCFSHTTSLNKLQELGFQYCLYGGALNLF
jgi:hypothetical protein